MTQISQKQVKELKVKTYTTNYKGVNIQFRRYGNIVECWVRENLAKGESIAGWASLTVATIPAGYRPGTAWSYEFFPMTASDYKSPIRVDLTPGELKLANRSGDTVTVPADGGPARLVWITTDTYPS